MQMSRGVKQTMSVVAVLMLCMTLAAGIAAAKGTKPVVNTTMSLYNSAFILGHELKAGDYNVAATDTMLTISQNNKVLVEAPITWKNETGKSQFSTFVTDGNKVTELHFSGKTQYAVVAN
jgi:hypothetical protein